MKKFCLLLSLGLVASYTLADVSSSGNFESRIKTPAKIASSNSTTEKFILSVGLPLSVSLLDQCWELRQKSSNQKIIADYLLSEPKIPQDYEIAWKTARLVYFIGNFGLGQKRFLDTKEGVKLFDYGVRAGKIAYQLQTNKVEGYYWYAIDLGSYGLAKGILSAAANAGDGMDALKKASTIDPSYQWYGSSRILGRYYQELPGIFGGSNKKALEMFELATTKAPEFDNNWLFLGRFYLSIKDYQNALVACGKALKLPPVDGKAEEIRYKSEAKDCVAKAKVNLPIAFQS